MKAKTRRMQKALLALISAATISGLQAKEMYSWTDENGVVHFSDTRPPGQQVTTEQIPGGTAANADDPYSGLTAEDQPTPGQARREELTQKKRAAQQEQAAMDAQCAAWRTELQRLEPNRRVFYTNEAGETERMDDVERTDRVAELKAQIGRDCA